MGLDVSHDCWSGAYSAFHRWRAAVAKAAGLPELDSMEGFTRGDRGVSWDVLKPRPLLLLLNHSDCDGTIAAKDCAALADDLEAVLPHLTHDDGEWGHLNDYREATQRFIDGLRRAATAGEDVEFH